MSASRQQARTRVHDGCGRVADVSLSAVPSIGQQVLAVFVTNLPLVDAPAAAL